MRTHPHEEYFLQVKKPQQYIGCEWNSSDPDLTLPRITLVYPDIYELGMSNFGLAVVRHVLLQSGRFDVRRAFSPSPDMDALMESTGLDWVDIERGEPVRESSVIGFGIPSEALFSNVLHLIKMSSIPLRANRRSADHPIILFGGGGISNPLPLAPFADLFFLGEAEEQIEELTGILCGFSAREDRLARASLIPGVWIPSLLRRSVEIQRVKKLRREWAPVKQLVPLAGISHDRAVVEVARGCTRGCRFCQATQLARPVRERSATESLCLLEKSILSTGWEKAGTLTLSFSDHTQVQELMAGCIELEKRLGVRIGQPSLRPDSFGRLSGNMRITGRVTIAPEAGSEELRARINKPLKDEQIFSAVDNAFQLGAKGVKLYFMIGLPGETEEDLAGIARLSVRIAEIARNHGRRSKKDVTVALSPFVPKAHTPFQWVPQLPLEEITRRLFLVRKACRRVTVSWNDPRLAVIEAVLGLGDDFVTADMLEEAVQAGAAFDAWDDLFRWDIWEKILEEHSSVLARISEGIHPDDPLPWDFVSTGVDRNWLREEFRRSMNGVSLPDCRDSGCSDCGACGGESVIEDPSSSEAVEGSIMVSGCDASPEFVLRVVFSRKDLARFSSHLDTVRLWMRTVRRSGLPVCYTRGYVTRPKLHFGPPLPLGFESTAEIVDVLLTGKPDSLEHIRDLLKDSLPDGFSVKEAGLMPPDTPSPDRMANAVSYLVSGVTEDEKLLGSIMGLSGVISVYPAGEYSISMLVDCRNSRSRPDRIMMDLNIRYSSICRTGIYTATDNGSYLPLKLSCMAHSNYIEGDDTP